MFFLRVRCFLNYNELQKIFRLTIHKYPETYFFLRYFSCLISISLINFKRIKIWKEKNLKNLGLTKN